jgi:hypothetical protein
MGNGLRGFRGSGAAGPAWFPDSDTWLTHAHALSLNASRYFNAGQAITDNTRPTLTVGGSPNPVDGLLRITFNAADGGSGLSSAMLSRNGESIAELALAGSNVAAEFATPIYTPGVSQNFTVSVYDRQGNRRNADLSLMPTAPANRAPEPFVTASRTTVRPGQSLVLNAGRSTDANHGAATLLVEWDLDGDGTFDTAPTTAKTLSVSFPAPGTRLIRARLTDPGGAQSVSTPIPLRVSADVAAPAADVVDVAPDPRAGAVDAMTITFDEPVFGLDLADLRLTRDGGAANLLTAAQPIRTRDNLTFTLGNLSGLTAPDGTYALTLAAPGSQIRDAVGNALAASASESWVVRTPAVIGRYVFYNNSAFDGNDPAAGADDDGAIAPDKVALAPGGTAAFANYTSYSRGINGIMLDVNGLPGAGEGLGVGDFAFRAGNDNAPSGWATPPGASPSVAVRAGAGVKGSHRVTLTWPDGALRNAWLQVTLLATANTGLASPDVFYFGNAVGESGNSTLNAQVTPADELAARSRPRGAANPAPVTWNWDHNRDRRVNPADQLIARTNKTTAAAALRLISVPGAAAPVRPPGVPRSPARASAPVLPVFLRTPERSIAAPLDRDGYAEDLLG